jgi:thermitase
LTQLRYEARAGLLILLAGMALGNAAQAQSPPSFVPGRVLVQFKAGVSAAQARGLLQGAGGQSVREIAPIGVHIVQLPPQASPVAVARAFKGKREVAFAEPDAVLPLTMVPDDPFYSTTWHLPRISCPAAWDITTGSSAVTIAIIDTGVDASHPDLQPKLVPGWNFYDNNSNTADVHGHGTAVAGAAAACSNNGLGVASPAWGCKIMPIRVADANGYATISALANAVTWAADRGVRVANISFGASNHSTLGSAAQYMRSKGGVVTVSAGNDGTFVTSPDDPYVLTISATDQFDAIASWSTTGNNVDLGAPGVSVKTTLRGGGTGSGSGTSFSAPVVAGVAALVISANPALTATQVESILKQGADDLGNPGWDPSYGWGRLNAARAVALATGGGTPPPPTPADTTPPSVSFSAPTSGATVSGTVSVQVAATDSGGVASVSLKVDGTDVATDTTSPYSFSWNTVTWANGTHILTATATDAAGNSASVQRTVTVSNPVIDSLPPEVSFTFPTTGATVSGIVAVQVAASDSGGVASVRLSVDGALQSTDTSAPYSFSWDSAGWPNGTHTLMATAVDAAGNTANTSIAVTVSNSTVAALAVADLIPNTVRSGGSIALAIISGTGFAPGAQVTFQNGEGPTPSAANVKVAADGKSLTLTVNTKPGGPGRNRYWDVVVTNPDGRSARKVKALTVLK